jgi:hypothetical protein
MISGFPVADCSMGSDQFEIFHAEDIGIAEEIE